MPKQKQTTSAELTDEMKKSIVHFYVGEKKSMSATAYRTGIPISVVSGYLNSSNQKRSRQENQRNSWFDLSNRASYAEHRAGKGE